MRSRSKGSGKKRKSVNSDKVPENASLPKMDDLQQCSQTRVFPSFPKKRKTAITLQETSSVGKDLIGNVRTSVETDTRCYVGNQEENPGKDIQNDSKLDKDQASLSPLGSSQATTEVTVPSLLETVTETEMSTSTRYRVGCEEFPSQTMLQGEITLRSSILEAITGDHSQNILQSRDEMMSYHTSGVTEHAEETVIADSILGLDKNNSLASPQIADDINGNEAIGTSVVHLDGSVSDDGPTKEQGAIGRLVHNLDGSVSEGGPTKEQGAIGRLVNNLEGSVSEGGPTKEQGAIGRLVNNLEGSVSEGGPTKEQGAIGRLVNNLEGSVSEGGPTKEQGSVSAEEQVHRITGSESMDVMVTHLEGSVTNDGPIAQDSKEIGTAVVHLDDSVSADGPTKEQEAIETTTVHQVSICDNGPIAYGTNVSKDIGTTVTSLEAALSVDEPAHSTKASETNGMMVTHLETSVSYDRPIAQDNKINEAIGRLVDKPAHSIKGSEAIGMKANLDASLMKGEPRTKGCEDTRGNEVSGTSDANPEASVLDDGPLAQGIKGNEVSGTSDANPEASVLDDGPLAQGIKGNEVVVCPKTSMSDVPIEVASSESLPCSNKLAFECNAISEPARDNDQSGKRLPECTTLEEATGGCCNISGGREKTNMGSDRTIKSRENQGQLIRQNVNMSDKFSDSNEKERSMAESLPSAKLSPIIEEPIIHRNYELEPPCPRIDCPEQEKLDPNSFSHAEFDTMEEAMFHRNYEIEPPCPHLNCPEQEIFDTDTSSHPNSEKMEVDEKGILPKCIVEEGVPHPMFDCSEQDGANVNSYIPTDPNKSKTVDKDGDIAFTKVDVDEVVWYQETSKVDPVSNTDSCNSKSMDNVILTRDEVNHKAVTEAIVEIETAVEKHELNYQISPLNGLPTSMDEIIERNLNISKEPANTSTSIGPSNIDHVSVKSEVTSGNPVLMNLNNPHIASLPDEIDIHKQPSKVLADSNETIHKIPLGVSVDQKYSSMAFDPEVDIDVDHEMTPERKIQTVKIQDSNWDRESEMDISDSQLCDQVEIEECGKQLKTYEEVRKRHLEGKKILHDLIVDLSHLNALVLRTKREIEYAKRKRQSQSFVIKKLAGHSIQHRKF